VDPVLEVFTLPEGLAYWFPIYLNTTEEKVAEFDCTNYGAPVGTFFTADPVSLPATTQSMKCGFLSLLVSYAGSNYVNAGQIVMAFTDPDWEPQSTNYFQDLSALPDRRYNGILKKGAYGWWCPLNINEGNPQPIDYWDRHPKLSSLWCAIEGADPTASIKIEVTMGLEFYAPEQIYSHIPSPMKAPIHDYIAAVWQNVPHCFENDTHDGVCDELVKKTHKALSAAIRDPVALGLGVLAVM